jgi:glutamate-1-semialdehyde 2,1-aminomutase
MTRKKSEALFAEALKHLPGGVNSPVRAFRAVGGKPFFVDRAAGAHIWDVDGNELVDYVGTWGPAIHGHAFAPIIDAVKAAAERGTSFSGTEACMSAIRLARGFTGRNKIIKFDGCYHGHADSLLVKAGSGALTFGNPDSAGVPKEFTAHTIVLPYNDAEAVREVFDANPDQIAGVIMEPVIGNAGLILPVDGFLQALRDITAGHGALLIFDEVMTGFRLSAGGAQERFGIRPDLSCFGKVIGGGLPVGAFGGRADVMACLAPEGPVYQAGTLSGNPLAMAAGIASLKALRDSNAHERLEDRGARLEEGMKAAAREAGVPVTFQRCGSMFCGYFGGHTVRNLDDAMRCDRERFAKYFHGMLDEGIYLAPSQFEAGFISTAHSDEDIERTVTAAARVLKRL